MIRKILQETFAFQLPQRRTAEHVGALFPDEEIEQIHEVPALIEPEGDDGDDDRTSVTSANLVVLMNWVITIVLLSGFFFILGETIWQPEHKIPPLVENIVSGTVGYMLSTVAKQVGASTEFVRSRATRRRRH